MAIVPPEMVAAYRLYKPEIRIEDNISHILEESKLPDDMKVKLLNQLVSRYRHTIYKPREPLPVNDRESEVIEQSMQKETEKVSEKDMNHILISVPKRLRSFIPLIVEKLESRQYSWNKDGEFMKEGEPLHDTNIVDLFSYLMRNTKDRPPLGFYEFVEALDQSKVPLRWIANSEVRKNWFPFVKRAYDRPLKRTHSELNLSTESPIKEDTYLKSSPEDTYLKSSPKASRSKWVDY